MARSKEPKIRMLFLIASGGGDPKTAFDPNGLSGRFEEM
jgi:hypothetical protein